MTTGHVLPGYGPIVPHLTQLRSKSADPTMSGYRFRGDEMIQEPALNFMNPLILAKIKRDAKNAWSEDMKDWMDTPEKRPTTYAHSFYRKGHVESEDPVILRPTSPTRRNKPHPKEVFMKCNLQKVPGYHDPYSAMGQEMNVVQGFQNPDSTVREDVYLVDGLCDRYERNSRQQLRKKYSARPGVRPNTTAVTQYHNTQREKLKRAMNDPRSAQAAEAWMKLANERDRKAAQLVIDQSQHLHPENTRTPRSPRMVQSADRTPFHASAHRFLKAAGHEEARAVDSLLQSTTAPKALPMSGPHFHITDYSKRIKVHPRHTRTDFTYHPEFYP